MPLNIALQIDPPLGLNPKGDTSLLLGREAKRRGHHVFYLKPESVSQASGGEVSGLVAPLELFAADASPHCACGDAQRLDLTQLDVILVRQDPPFDMGYISNSLILERVIEHGTLVLNHPAAVRNNPEKMLPFRFPEYTPPTLISGDVAEIRAFHAQHGAMVLKPAYGYGGRGVFKINAEGENLEALLETMLPARASSEAVAQHSNREPLVAQQFLPDVNAEEKRIILINGKLAGAFGRIPQTGEIRSNMRVGGQAVATELSQRQHDIAYDVGKLCESMGLMLAGLDVIGDWLIEVNVTSPTGLVQLKELYGTAPEADFWDGVEEVMQLRDKVMGTV